MVFKKLTILILLILLGTEILRSEGHGSNFVVAQIKFQGNWDPYPGYYKQIYYYLSNTTSLRVSPERKIITLNDKKLYEYPFLIMIGKGRYPEFSEDEIIWLRRYIYGGGIIFIDSCADKEFENSVDNTIKRVFPNKKYEKVAMDHALFRSFYLVKYVSGRNIQTPYIEAININGRYAVIKSRNDIIGIWPRDAFGNWEYGLIPGKYGQRKEAIKMTLNILLYSVCGTYKNDPVHEPHIKRKLNR